MATSVQQMRDSLNTITDSDEELRVAYRYLDDAMGMPLNETFLLMILLDELKKRMKEDVVCFSFRKKDGTIRSAYGTRVPEVIHRHETPSASAQKKHPRCAPGTFPYFDIERRAWRCFKVEGIMDINRGYTI